MLVVSWRFIYNIYQITFRVVLWNVGNTNLDPQLLENIEWAIGIT